MAEKEKRKKDKREKKAKGAGGAGGTASLPPESSGSPGIAPNDPVVLSYLKTIDEAASRSRAEFLAAVRAAGSDESLSEAQRKEIVRFLARGQAEGLRALTLGGLFGGSGSDEEDN